MNCDVLMLPVVLTKYGNVNCVFSLFVAYQLRVCQPPTNIPNAEILTEDDEFEIGNMTENKCSVSNKMTALNRNLVLFRSQILHVVFFFFIIFDIKHCLILKHTKPTELPT